MANDEAWQPARLFPITGIGGAEEQERRGTSVLLAVMQSVKEFGRALTTRCGAPAGRIETFIEVPFELAAGSKVRPDGLIRVTRGQTMWRALVEVKAGRVDLRPDQLNNYLDVARANEFDAVITISHQVATTPGVHPVQVDRRKTKKVALHHLSWSRIHTEALIQQTNHVVGDPDQAWLLSEFIRYIEEPKAGALDFEDMGAAWPSVRDAAAKGTLRPNDEQTLAVVARFDQLIAFCGMQLSRRLGVHVQQQLTRSELADPAARVQNQASQLADTGQLSGSLAIPNAAAPLDIVVDLRAGRVDCCGTIGAPLDVRAPARANWLLRQVKAAPPKLGVVANIARSRVAGASYELSVLLDDPRLLVPNPAGDVRSFTLTLSQVAGTKRGQGRGSFVSSVTSLVDTFYVDVVQHLKPWTPTAPKPKSNATDGNDSPVLVEPPNGDPNDFAVDHMSPDPVIPAPYAGNVVPSRGF
jgi:hypothetical protein